MKSNTMKSNTLSVLTFKIAGLPVPLFAHARIQKFCHSVEKMPDLSVVNIQEAHTYDILWHLRLGLRSFPYVVYKPGIWGVQGGVVTFTKFPLKESEFIFFSNSRRKGMLVMKTPDRSLAII